MTAIRVSTIGAPGDYKSSLIPAIFKSLNYQIESKEAPVNRTFRLGGLVVAGSVKRTGVAVDFMVTDTAKSVPVHFEGILPDLFKEGKGVVAQGKLQDGVFVAKEVLAKHDENSMPPEAAEALKNAAKSNQKTAASIVMSK